MAETSSSSGRKRAKVDGPLASSSASVKLADLNAKTFTPPASVLKAAKSAILMNTTKHISVSYNG